jgi:V-type H+-transporting ATPase subunit D
MHARTCTPALAHSHACTHARRYGLARGGKEIEKCTKKWTTLFENLIQLASLQTSFLALDEAIKVTNRRVNALDNVVIPRTTNTIKCVGVGV